MFQQFCQPAMSSSTPPVKAPFKFGDYINTIAGYSYWNSQNSNEGYQNKYKYFHTNWFMCFTSF